MPSRPHLLRVLVDDTMAARGGEARVVFEMDSVAAMKAGDERRRRHDYAGGAVRRELEDGRLIARRVVDRNFSHAMWFSPSADLPQRESAHRSSCYAIRLEISSLETMSAGGRSTETRHLVIASVRRAEKVMSREGMTRVSCLTVLLQA